MNTKQYTFYALDGNKIGVRGTAISLEQGTYKVLGYLERSKKLETVAQFPMSNSYYTVENIFNDAAVKSAEA
jgi:hypothetical protein